jgi:hypothetical protein
MADSKSDVLEAMAIQMMAMWHHCRVVGYLVKTMDTAQMCCAHTFHPYCVQMPCIKQPNACLPLMGLVGTGARIGNRIFEPMQIQVHPGLLFTSCLFIVIFCISPCMLYM